MTGEERWLSETELYDTREFIIGEQYVNMVSDWQTINTQDNDVHEVFKCMGEVMLNNAFVIERADGSFVGYNCTIVDHKGGHLIVKANEKQITNLHCNVKNKYTVSFNGQNKKVDAGSLGWIFGTGI